MSIAISLKRKPDGDDEELLLFPEAAHLAPVPEAETPAGADQWLGGDEARLSIDVYETDREIVIMSAIAGVKPENLEVFVHNDMLTVRGKRAVEEVGGRPLVRECHWGAFSRSVILPTEIDTEAIAAVLKDGVLTVKLPKTNRSRRISVKEL